MTNTLSEEQIKRFDDKFSFTNAPMKVVDDNGFFITPEPMRLELKQHLADEIALAKKEERDLYGVPCDVCNSFLEPTTTGYNEEVLDFIRYYCPICKAFYEGDLVKKLSQTNIEEGI